MTKLLDQANMWSGASFMAGMAFLAIAIVIDRVWEAA
jgi:ABC-type proline/glycine betaine transport system permease subunit